MIVCIDVDYRNEQAIAALVLVEDWTSSKPSAVHTKVVNPVNEYEPGQFYRRELPCILAVLESYKVQTTDAILIDGYVWLDGASKGNKPGLGAHLFEALGQHISVVGVAKTRFRDCPSVPVLRGGSSRPLYITAAGMDAQKAATHVQEMHGPYRVPTIIKLADSIGRCYQI